MLIDSNIIIYASLPEYARLREFIATEAPAVSAVSYVEVLGYHGLAATEESLFREFFAPVYLIFSPLHLDSLLSVNSQCLCHGVIIVI